MTAADSGGEPPSLSPDCPLHSAGSSSEKRTGMVYLDALAEPRHSANHQPVIGNLFRSSLGAWGSGILGR
jgi:hypothetical protein